MRYRLRTLLIVMMLAGPLIGLAWKWREANLARIKLLRIQAENERWRKAAIKSSPVRNGLYVISEKTKKEYQRRFGRPWPEKPPWFDSSRNGGSSYKPEPPPGVYIPPSQYDNGP